MKNKLIANNNKIKKFFNDLFILICLSLLKRVTIIPLAYNAPLRGKKQLAIMPEERRTASCFLSFLNGLLAV
jgi:hypothetical protein